MHATRTALPDQRWHLQHGPIDIVIGAEGDADAVAAAHDGAWQRFAGVLGELVAELPLLRSPVAGGACPLRGPVAERMWQACAALARRGEADPVYITPMAAVAGAVADALIAPYRRPGVRRAWVNNGGDIAWHLAAGEALRVGLVADVSCLQFVGTAPRARNMAGAADGADAAKAIDGAYDPAALARLLLQPDGAFTVHAEQPSRGLATSGWRGRSHSLGIADSVTVLAATSAQADAAATLIANAVNVDDPRITRRPACELKDDSDLGERLVTTQVPALGAAAVRAALARGLALATALQRAGHIDAAVLVCQGEVATLAERARPLRLKPNRTSCVEAAGAVLA